jgi:pantetheine-phosphate adenylyltransferase
MSERIAFYGASLDPVTNGHMWVIEQGAKMFDKLIVGIAINPAKTYTYTVDERITMVRESCLKLPNVNVLYVGSHLLAPYAQEQGAKWLIRGLRSPSDFEFEQNMAHVNADLAPSVTTVLLCCPPELGRVSSSVVRHLAAFSTGLSVAQKYVPAPVRVMLDRLVKDR